uniref:Uncharacterized protein n=1 Tax=Anguilla anguilla TaxID=7936 RepID=A0A0E9QPK5_ANGAN
MNLTGPIFIRSSRLGGSAQTPAEAIMKNNSG